MADRRRLSRLVLPLQAGFLLLAWAWTGVTQASPIATSIEPAKEFYRAEEYHQRYLDKKGLRVCH